MADTRRKNVQWRLPEAIGWEHVEVALLMDLRDELRALNTLLDCYKFRGLPDVLTRIDRRLEKAGLLLSRSSKGQRRSGHRRSRTRTAGL